MEVWIKVLAFVLFLGFGTAVIVCVNAIKRQSQIIIASRLRHKTNRTEIIYANLCLVAIGILAYFNYYLFVPALMLLALFIVLSTRVVSGITNGGILIGTTFLEWEFIKGYKIINDDINTITLKLRANKKQYVLICDKSDRSQVEKLLKNNNIKRTETV